MIQGLEPPASRWRSCRGRRGTRSWAGFLNYLPMRSPGLPPRLVASSFLV